MILALKARFFPRRQHNTPCFNFRIERIAGRECRACVHRSGNHDLGPFVETLVPSGINLTFKIDFLLERRRLFPAIVQSHQIA